VLLVHTIRDMIMTVNTSKQKKARTAQSKYIACKINALAITKH